VKGHNKYEKKRRSSWSLGYTVKIIHISTCLLCKSTCLIYLIISTIGLILSIPLEINPLLRSFRQLSNAYETERETERWWRHLLSFCIYSICLLQKKKRNYIYIYIYTYIHRYIQIHYFNASKMISQCIRGDGKKNCSYCLSFILIFIENSSMNRSW